MYYPGSSPKGKRKVRVVPHLVTVTVIITVKYKYLKQHPGDTLTPHCQRPGTAFIHTSFSLQWKVLAGLADLFLPFPVVNRSTTTSRITFKHMVTYRDKNYLIFQVSPSETHLQN